MPYAIVSWGRLLCQNGLPLALLQFCSSVSSDVAKHSLSRRMALHYVTSTVEVLNMHTDMPVPTKARSLALLFIRILTVICMHFRPPNSSQVVSAPAGTKLNCLCPVPPHTHQEKGRRQTPRVSHKISYHGGGLAHRSSSRLWHAKPDIVAPKRVS